MIPKINFNIQSAKINKKTGTVPIIAKLVINYIPVTKTISRVKPKHWNPDKQRVKPSRVDETYNDYIETNELIDAFEADLKLFLNQCKKNNTDITSELVKSYFDGSLKSSLPAKKDIWNVWEDYLEHIANTKEKTTAKAHKAAKIYFKTFSEEYSYPMTFENIDLIFHDKFTDYVLNKREHHYNYLQTLSRRLKSFMKWAYDREYHNSLKYQKIKISEKPGNIVSLSVEQFNILYNYQFSSDRLAKARDIFCFGCLVGLRVSDLMRLSRENIFDGMIVTNMKKVADSKTLHIPILEKAQRILDKYKEQYFLLPKLSDQKLNDYIKEAARESGLNFPIKIRTFKKGTAEEYTTTLDNLIHAHMTRKTFITLAFAANIDIETIKAISGIRGERTLRHYLFISNDLLKEKTMLLSQLVEDTEK